MGGMEGKWKSRIHFKINL